MMTMMMMMKMVMMMMVMMIAAIIIRAVLIECSQTETKPIIYHYIMTNPTK